MAKLELSQDELAFSFLIESHKIVCKWLSDFALAAVKHNNPKDWKDKVCACFAAGVKRYVRERLENSLPLTDIYAVCKLITRRINDVAKFCGGDLLDPRKKERFSLQAQGVMMARNIAFHEEFVSVREVLSSVHMMTSLLVSTHSKQGQVTAVIASLSALTKGIDANLTSASSEEWAFSPSTIAQALLYSSFGELSRRFLKYFESSEGNALSEKRDIDESVNGQSDVSTLINRIRKQVHDMRSCELAKVKSSSRYTKEDCFKICKTILAERNAFAHSPNQTLLKIRHTLLDIENLLAIFGLSNSQIVYSFKRLDMLRDDSQQLYNCTLSKENPPSFFRSGGRGREMVLQPRGRYFVGRTRELCSIPSLLSSERIVVIFGQAGVGKTYLATELAHRLIEAYPQQTWLACTDAKELASDLAHRKHHYPPEEGPGRRAVHAHALITANVSGERDVPKVLRKLFVLDDVCSSTVSHICKQFLQVHRSCIITTRSTAVKEALQRLYSPLFVVHLQPFSTAESMQLIKAKTANSKLFLKRPPLSSSLALLKPVNDVLCNLPLAISIYSSMLAFTAKQEVTYTILDLVDNHFLIKAWKGTEEQFGDSLHVRGLTGVIHSSESYLKDRPLVVLLLVKICLCNTEKIPWEVLNHSGSPKRFMPTYTLSQCNSPSSQKLFSELLGVSDWLFSSIATNTLRTCRDALEELGLISLEDSAATVCIHRLTLYRVREMLEERNHFLDGLVSSNAGKLGAVRKNVVNLMCRCLRCELQVQMFYCSAALLNEVNTIIYNDEVFERYYEIFLFLSESFTKPRLVEMMQIIANHNVFAELLVNTMLTALGDFRVITRFPGSRTEGMMWTQLVKTFKEELANRKRWETFCYVADIIKNLTPFRLGEALWDSQRMLADVQEHFGRNSHLIAVWHCMAAHYIQAARGPAARRLYIWQAAQSCPTLGKCPTANDIASSILGRLAKVWRNNDFKYLMELCEDPQLKYSLLSSLTSFQVIDSFERSGTIDDETYITMSLLILYCREMQHLLEEKIGKMTDEHSRMSNNVRTLYCLSYLIEQSYEEASLYEYLKRRGLSFRVIMKTLNTVEALLGKISNIPIGSTLWNVFSNTMESLVKAVALQAWQMGHFSVSVGLARRFVPQLLDNRESQPDPCKMKDTIEESRETGLQLHVNGSFVCLEGLWQLYVKKDFEGAVHSFNTSFVLNITGSTKTDESSRFYYVLTLAHARTVCVLRGQLAASRTLAVLRNLLKNERLSQDQFEDIHQTIEYISHLPEHPKSLLTGITTLFMKARDACEQELHLIIRKESLKCWREILCFHEIQEKNVFDEPIASFILGSMLLDLAGFLRHVYCEEKKYDTAEWFLRFRIGCAKSLKWHFLAGKHASEYVEFLKEREKWSEAQWQSNLFQRTFAEEFGDDYAEWLSDAPNFTVMDSRADAEATGMCLQRVKG